jgi:signal transduction histidine kinase
VVARHRVSPGEGDGGVEEAPGWPTADWAGAPKPPPGRGQPGTGLLARAMVVMLWPRSIRAKLVRILVVSLTLVLVLLGFLITQETTNYQAAGSTSQIVTVVLRVQDVVHQLQEERALTNGLLGGGTQFQAQIVPQRTATDQALATLNQTLGNSGYDATVTDQVRGALTKLDGLQTIRTDIDQQRAQAAPTFAFYTDSIGALNNLDLGLDHAVDGQLRHGLQALYALDDAKEFAGQEQGLLAAVFAANRVSIDNYTKFAEVLGQKQAAIATYDEFATPTERNALDTVLQSAAADQAVQFEGVAIGGAAGTMSTQVDPVAWTDAMNTVIDNLRNVEQTVGQDITSRANSLRNTATALLIGISILAVLTIAAMIALVVGAARSVIGPLGQLARDADAVSGRRLPETVALMQTTETEVPPPPPVTVPAGAASEIKLVATALDRVQNTALTLASEQALIRRNTTASLANLGRRNQNLVRRQLALISEFEREELDPGALANMFELDHLATRMRRNAESLLVLVGETSPRAWSAPLPIADVIRAALSEVEEYRRVVLRRVDPAWVAGAAVTEVAHMLAELVENGLSFSSPDVEVEIYGRKTGGRYLLAVVDYGIGMPKEELEKAKARLRDEENFLVAPTRFLGHYVVGRLARQMSVQVDLGESPVSGITARMLLPAEIMAERPDSPGDIGRPARQAAARSLGQPSAPALAAPVQPALVAPPEPVAPRAPVVAVVPSFNEPATVITRPVAEPTKRPVPTGRAEAPPIHRWPTEQESVSLLDPPSQQPVTVAAIANSAPYDPTQANAAQYRGTPAYAKSAAQTEERTRNGLVKRQPRHRGAATTRPPAAPSSAPRHTAGADATNTDRSPTEVGSMLSAFRRGHQRGELTGRHANGTAPASSHVDNEEEPGDH